MVCQAFAFVFIVASVKLVSVEVPRSQLSLDGMNNGHKTITNILGKGKTFNAVTFNNKATKSKRGVIPNGSQHSCKLLFFHEGASKNAVVTRNSSHMLSDADDRPYAAVWTNRHLKSNELFEVKFERMENSKNESIYLVAIGVTNTTHDDINNIRHIEPRNWMMQWIIKAEDEDDSGFQKFLKFGIKFGIMRTEEGNLDIFVNGVNEGTISEGVPKSVYGVIEFLTGGLQATIIGSSSTSC